MAGATHSLSENLWISIFRLTLRVAARRLKVSARELVDEVLPREAGSARERSQELASILRRLPSYRAEDLDADIAELAHAEVTEEDPLRARRIVPEDLHGVGAAFGHRLERRPL
jgi:hypothetical protein